MNFSVSQDHQLAPEAAASCEGRPITQPIPALDIDRVGVEHGGPSTPVQQSGAFQGQDCNGSKDNSPHGVLPVMFYLTPNLVVALSSVGALPNKRYTFREILKLLKDHILKNQSTLIDATDPRYVSCKGTPLSKAFGIDRFGYNEVKSLLWKNIVRVPNFAFVSEHRFQCQPTVPPSETLFPSISTTSFLNRYNKVLSLCVPNVPEPHSSSETEYSYQGYETALCDDPDDDILDSHPEDLLESEDEVEYELVTEEEEDANVDPNDSMSDVESLILIVEEQPESFLDEDCFADESNTSTSDESENSTDDEVDKWSCVTCGIKNKPFVPYCQKCWKLRKDWYPERKKRRRKRKPRPKKENARSSLTRKNMASLSNAEDAKVDAHTLVRDGSFASCSTQSSSVSTISVLTASSQDSGIGSQELSSYESTHSTSKELSSYESTHSTSKELSSYELVPATSKVIAPQDLDVISQKIWSPEPVPSTSKGISSSQDSGIGSQEIWSYEPIPSTSKVIAPQDSDIVSREIWLHEPVPSTSKGISSSQQSRKLSTYESTHSTSKEHSSYESIPSTSKEGSDIRVDIRVSTTSASQELSSSEVIPQSRKRKFSIRDEIKEKRKGLKIFKSSVQETLSPTKLQTKIRKFIESSSGQHWLRSSYAQTFLEGLEDISSNSEAEEDCSEDLCPLCCARPKNASIIHGGIAHIGFCYPCVKNLFKSKAKCPVCRRKIHMITKNVSV